MKSPSKSTAELAAEQAAYWNGPGGKGWLASYRRIERGIAAFSAELLAAAAAQPGEHVVDVGCGTGATTAELARAVGATGHVLGIDISETLIEAARSQRVDNATFVLGDAGTHPFKAASYDLVFSRFGVMFFGDPVAAFSNFRQALKPTGRLVFVCWRTPQENPWGHVPLRAAQPFLPPLPRPGPDDPGQYSFGDRARVERILKESGFGPPDIRPIDRPVSLGNGHGRDPRQCRPLRSPGARLCGCRAGGHRKGQGRHRRGTRTASWAGGRDAARRLLAGECGRALMEHITSFPLPPVTLVLGGARSGKSTHAEKLATGTLFGGAPQPAVYVATARRATSRWRPASWPIAAAAAPAGPPSRSRLKLAEALEAAATHGQPVLVDCLTLWLSNLMHAGADIDEATDELVGTLEGYASPVVFVSNEVGLGLVPETPLGRSFRDSQGRLNMRVAARADRVILMAAGLPLTMKDRPPR